MSTINVYHNGCRQPALREESSSRGRQKWNIGSNGEYRLRREGNTLSLYHRQQFLGRYKINPRKADSIDVFIPTRAEDFDPSIHIKVSAEKQATLSPQHICRAFRNGYTAETWEVSLRDTRNSAPLELEYERALKQYAPTADDTIGEYVDYPNTTLSLSRGRNDAYYEGRMSVRKHGNTFVISFHHMRRGNGAPADFPPTLEGSIVVSATTPTGPNLRSLELVKKGAHYQLLEPSILQPTASPADHVSALRAVLSRYFTQHGGQTNIGIAQQRWVTQPPPSLYNNQRAYRLRLERILLDVMNEQGGPRHASLAEAARAFGKSAHEYDALLDAAIRAKVSPAQALRAALQHYMRTHTNHGIPAHGQRLITQPSSGMRANETFYAKRLERVLINVLQAHHQQDFSNLDAAARTLGRRPDDYTGLLQLTGQPAPAPTAMPQDQEIVKLQAVLKRAQRDKHLSAEGLVRVGTMLDTLVVPDLRDDQHRTLQDEFIHVARHIAPGADIQTLGDVQSLTGIESTNYEQLYNKLRELHSISGADLRKVRTVLESAIAYGVLSKREAVALSRATKSTVDYGKYKQRLASYTLRVAREVFPGHRVDSAQDAARLTKAKSASVPDLAAALEKAVAIKRLSSDERAMVAVLRVAQTQSKLGMKFSSKDLNLPRDAKRLHAFRKKLYHNFFAVCAKALGQKDIAYLSDVSRALSLPKTTALPVLASNLTAAINAYQPATNALSLADSHARIEKAFHEHRDTLAGHCRVVSHQDTLYIVVRESKQKNISKVIREVRAVLTPVLANMDLDHPVHIRVNMLAQPSARREMHLERTAKRALTIIPALNTLHDNDRLSVRAGTKEKLTSDLQGLPSLLRLAIEADILPGRISQELQPPLDFPTEVRIYEALLRSRCVEMAQVLLNDETLVFFDDIKRKMGNANLETVAMTQRLAYLAHERLAAQQEFFQLSATDKAQRDILLMAIQKGIVFSVDEKMLTTTPNSAGELAAYREELQVNVSVLAATLLNNDHIDTYPQIAEAVSLPTNSSVIDIIQALYPYLTAYALSAQDEPTHDRVTLRRALEEDLAPFIGGETDSSLLTARLQVKAISSLRTLDGSVIVEIHAEKPTEWETVGKDFGRWLNDRVTGFKETRPGTIPFGDKKLQIHMVGEAPYTEKQAAFRFKLFRRGLRKGLSKQNAHFDKLINIEVRSPFTRQSLREALHTFGYESKKVRPLAEKKYSSLAHYLGVASAELKRSHLELKYAQGNDEAVAWQRAAVRLGQFLDRRIEADVAQFDFEIRLKSAQSLNDSEVRKLAKDFKATALAQLERPESPHQINLTVNAEGTRAVVAAPPVEEPVEAPADTAVDAPVDIPTPSAPDTPDDAPVADPAPEEIPAPSPTPSQATNATLAAAFTALKPAQVHIAPRMEHFGDKKIDIALVTPPSTRKGRAAFFITLAQLAKETNKEILITHFPIKMGSSTLNGPFHPDSPMIKAQNDFLREMNDILARNSDLAALRVPIHSRSNQPMQLPKSKDHYLYGALGIALLPANDSAPATIAPVVRRIISSSKVQLTPDKVVNYVSDFKSDTIFNRATHEIKTIFTTRNGNCVDANGLSGLVCSVSADTWPDVKRLLSAGTNIYLSRTLIHPGKQEESGLTLPDGQIIVPGGSDTPRIGSKEHILYIIPRGSGTPAENIERIDRALTEGHVLIETLDTLRK